ncbi:E3 ubiquitin-protein ligase MYCBP2-like [Leptonychotes weddellii]|uniref:E3 ubiquitin-protein ligase MYCBP2-like n=1 Tax=Leptonychotes weddellii TaxID=9713 RepID=A0A7F8QFB3_LEPWE|nr:E3 ubiquitin-protein ligase MYCBP2-like [Leptonychotes weddellii]
MSRTTADQKKPRGTEGLSASESLMLKSDAAKLRSDSHSRSLSPNHNTLQTLKSDGRMSSSFRAESPGPGSRSSSPKPKTLPTNRSSPSGASSPRSSSPHDKNLPQKSTAPVKTKLDPPRERSKSDSYTLDPDTLRKKKMPLTEPLRGRSTSPKPKTVPKDSKDSPGSENRAPSPHVVQENLHSEVVEVCTSSTLKTNSLTDSTCDESSEFKSVDESSNKVHFSIGKAPLKDEQEMRASPKISRKCANRHTRPKKEKSSFLFKGDGSKPLEPAKQAMSPSVAECARAVFASFLWHEGIVHDAMACSSFLKFNPELSKEHAPIRNSLNSQQPTEEKETKLKNRHSLEISSALNMFNIAPHGPDISKMGSINKNKVLSMLKEPPLHEKCEDGKTEATFEMSMHHPMKSKSPLPLTLQHLVAFWEDISLATIKAASQNMIFPSPGSCAVLKKKECEKENKKAKKDKKKKEKTEVRPRGNLFGEMAQLAVGGPEKDTICELCGESHPYPVTYHMRQAHPGCGRYAGGQGYNSIGHFCGGWAGNCGDGGIGGSTWYLVCDRCREKYLREKQAAAREKVKQSRRKPMQVKTPRALPTMEAHQVIKANALFLLSLSSAAEPSILCYHPTKPFQSHLPSVKEGISEDLPVKMPCLYLQTLARHHHENFVGYQDDNLFQDEMRYLRSTSVPAPYISVTPDASPNVFEEPESNMKSMPPRYFTSLLSVE